MAPSDHDRIETLLAEALAAHDQGGEAALAAFVEAHAGDRSALERGLLRCRQMGLLGEVRSARDFPERLGEFRLVRRLGSGGMGVVYEAAQESLGRSVALKLVRPELLYFEGARERFRREIEAVARLQHPAIVPVLASGEQDGVPFYAMELMQGLTVQELCTALAGRDPATLRAEDLRTALGSDGSGTDPLHGAWWQVCVRVVHAVALGVRHAHLRGIVHRDIKPSNVMLTRDGRSVLLDFGVALLGGRGEFTRTGNTPGSPAFMSPEQLRGDAVDERTDVYSLGATLWQMLALVPPFRGEKDLQRIRDGELPSLLARNREVPHELVVVVHKAMDRDRERRYPDVEAFADDLLAVLQRRPIRARRLGLPLRTWRWCQRHRGLATGLAAMLLLGLLLPLALVLRERQLLREMDQSLGATLQAIQTILVEVGSDRLRHQPGGDAIAGKALTEAVALHRALLRKHADNPRLVGNAADTLMALALHGVRHGQPAQAQELFAEAVARLGGDDPTVPSGRLLKRSLAHTHLGDLAAKHGDRARADREYAAAAVDLDGAARDEALRVDTMRARVELALQRLLHGDFTTAPELPYSLGNDAVRMARQLCAEKDNPSDAVQLASLLQVLGNRHRRDEQLETARSMLEEALAIARALPADAPIWPPASQVTASVLQTLGLVKLDQRDRSTFETLKEALALREAGVAEQPHDVLLRSELGAMLHTLAQMNVAQAQDELALERLDRAITEQRRVVAAMPTFVQGHDYLRNHLTLRGTQLARLGRADDLQANAEELAAMRTDPSALRSAARHFLRLATLREASPPATGTALDAEGCRARALQLLVDAEAIGWGPNNPLDEALYAPLQGRPEFEALRTRVAARVQSPRRG
ncbi:MAG: serine/threonine protein kinase [Planctomycetes bacterium]|nr:serine/threonine protein kinase [Planctomycetota bacterium]